MFRLVSYPIVRRFTSIAIVAAAFLAAGAHAQEVTAEFQDGQSKTVSLQDVKGKPVLLNLWASWCEPCVREMPSLAALQDEYKGKGLVVLALSEDDTPDAGVAFYKAKSITSLPPYFDKGHKVWAALHVSGIPISLLISRDGKIVKRIEGPVDWQSPEIRKTIDQLVSTN